MIHHRNIFSEFKNLSSKDDRDFSVITIHNTQHKLGVSKEGYPKFFVSTNDKTSTTPNKLLNILTVEYNLSCTFIDEDNTELSHYYTVITLLSSDNSLQEYFLDIVIMMLERLPASPSKQEIAGEIENLISIFSAMSCPPRKKLQGLWAELLVIEKSFNPEVLISAWHQIPTAKFDFTAGRDKIEVKSTSSSTRKHHFSLDQLTPSTSSRVIVASIIVRESAPGEGGLSISELCEKIFERVQSVDARINVMRIVAETLGKDFKKMDDMYFDYCEASDTLRFYDSNDVPRVNKDGVQIGVSSVGFESDLSDITDILSKQPSYDRGKSVLYNSLYE